MSLGFIIYCIRGVVLIFGDIDLVSAIYHFMAWTRKGRPTSDDDDSSVFSDWKSGERSPVKVSLAAIACITALALIIVVQGMF